MTYMKVREAEIVNFEWDQFKSDRNVLERDLPFDLAMLLFDGPTLEQPDDRHEYRELRVKAIGKALGVILQCVYTDRPGVRRIISLRPANRRERDAYRAAYEN